MMIGDPSYQAGSDLNFVKLTLEDALLVLCSVTTQLTIRQD